MYCKLFMLYLS